MTNLCTVSRRFHGFKAVALAAFVICHSSFGIAAPAPAVPVVAVEATRTADLVLLGGGFNAGLRQGMVCRVTRSGAAVAEVLLIELRPACASALILSLAPGQSVRAGDVASVKILKT